VNESPDASEGKAYRQSPDGPDLIESPAGRGRRIFLALVILIGLAALALAGVIVVRHLHRPTWEAPALAGAGVVFALLGAVGIAGGRNRSSYRFDSSSSRALTTLGRMHDKK
jgi:membrane associated rhomboid family serine protease